MAALYPVAAAGPAAEHRHRRPRAMMADAAEADAAETDGMPNAHKGRSIHLDSNVWKHHDASMRTTLTLDPDVAERLASETRRTGKSLKALVNDAIRLGLGLTGKPPKSPRFKVEPHAFGLRAGIDPDRLNQLIDELEVDDAARRLSR